MENNTTELYNAIEAVNGGDYTGFSGGIPVGSGYVSSSQAEATILFTTDSPGRTEAGNFDEHRKLHLAYHDNATGELGEHTMNVNRVTVVHATNTEIVFRCDAPSDVPFITGGVRYSKVHISPVMDSTGSGIGSMRKKVNAVPRNVQRAIYCQHKGKKVNCNDN